MNSAGCRKIVCEILTNMGYEVTTINLSEIETTETLTVKDLRLFQAALIKVELDLIEDKKEILVENIKLIILEMLARPDDIYQQKNSDYISNKVHYDYTYLSNLFTKATGITIEQYIISCKVNRVKELLLCNNLNLTEISYLLNYSSLAHLSAQFKKTTGLSPSLYKRNCCSVC